MHYMSRLQSVEVLKELLFQYGSEENMIMFLQRLYNIVEKQLPNNSIYFPGLANCGKTTLL